jgi:bacteriocin biosynthesis cyclodehydratase domain-containing protein
LTADTAHRVLRHRGTPDEIAAARTAAAVIVHGDGRIGIGVATGLAAAGVGWVHLATSGRVCADDCGNGYRDSDIDRDRAKVAANVLRESAPAVRTDRLPAARTPTLVILADSPAVAPDLAQGLYTSGIPHLLTYPRGAVGVVGPLVLPGWTSCLRCLDLHRTDRDPRWPRLAAQLAGRPQPTPLSVAAAIVAAAVAQALLVIDGKQPGLPPDSAVDIDPEQLTTERRVWARHPACACRAINQERGQKPSTADRSGVDHPAEPRR